jgi:acyl carrier protein
MTNTPSKFDQLQLADPAARALIVENHAIELIKGLRQPDSIVVDPSSRLADLGIDSLDAVELKYSLDELLGSESDTDVFIRNPSIREMAEELVRQANL